MTKICNLCNDEIDDDDPYVVMPTTQKVDHVLCYLEVILDIMKDPLSRELIKRVSEINETGIY